METEQLPPLERVDEDRSAYAGVLRYYELAKRAEWQVRDLPWNDLPPDPRVQGLAAEAGAPRATCGAR